MKTLLTRLLLLCLAGLLGGCATHYYRMAKSGNDTVFYLRHSEAESVLLFASLDGYRPREAQLGKGRWTNTLPGSEEFTYFYRVDGDLYIPDCRYRERDDFGQENCIFIPER